jgi:tRNA-Thr(GGU) m(6)t(6)A37 methyltransferase TsaA
MLEKLLFLCLSVGGVFLLTYLWGCAMGTALPSFTLHPIGYVKKEGSKTFLVIDEAYKDGLLGMEGFSHIYVYFWFDLNDTPEKRAILRVHPMANPNNPLTGVFATRSPMRPNLVGMTLSRVLKIEGSILEIDWTDALENTPILDIKPFIQAIDCAESPKVPAWLASDDWVKGPQGAHRYEEKRNGQP